MRAPLTCLVALGVCLVAACSGVPYDLVGHKGVYTQSVLHPDEKRGLLYSVNYQRGGYVPVCTEVVIRRVNREEAVFDIEQSGRTYHYLFHKSLRESIPKHLDKVFGRRCDPADFAAMSDIDQQGISEGRVFVGMTRQGVLRAIGHPPSHATPYLERDVWKYWYNRFGTFDVVFSHDVVTEVRGGGADQAQPVAFELADGSPVYTLVNLHPDEDRRRLYSTNYQREGLIPFCTPVTIASVTTEKMVFTTTETGRTYEYLFHNQLVHGITDHLGLYFGRTCNADAVNTLGDDDRKGIASGRVGLGMTKAGVLTAIGYPPTHATPALEGNVWTYWISRFNKMKVLFKDDRVTHVVH